MSCGSDDDGSVEALVAAFLDRRMLEPGLSPAAFATGHGERAAAIERAIASAIAVERLLISTIEDGQPGNVGPYRVLGRLGSGGMGVVYGVERDGAAFALKLLSPALAGDVRAFERFQREARGLARLAHPGIVRVHETGLFQGMPYLVMERLEGPTLAEIARPIAPERAARIVGALARAVGAAHAAGVLHRDLKPSNVVLRAGDAPALLDFGLVAAEDEDTLTASGALLGTPRYMAPEQAEGRPADARSDVYALGLLLHELLTGVPARRDGSREEVLAEARRGRVRPVSAGVPPALRRVLGCTLAREPRRRPASAAALAEALERFLAGESVGLRPPNALQRLADTLARHPRRLVAGSLALGMVALLVRPAWQEIGRARAARAAERLADESRAALAGGDAAHAVPLALRAVDALASSGGDASAELPRLLGLAHASAGTLVALEQWATAHPGDALAHFALAYAHDSQHHLERAVGEYQRALEADPGLVRAHTNLAHLYSGAQIGACQACDEAYARSPRMLDPRRAVDCLDSALRLDRGNSDWCVGRAVQTTLTLMGRAPEVRADAHVSLALQSLLSASPPPSADARGRIDEGLQRLLAAQPAPPDEF